MVCVAFGGIYGGNLISVSLTCVMYKLVFNIRCDFNRLAIQYSRTLEMGRIPLLLFGRNRIVGSHDRTEAEYSAEVRPNNCFQSKRYLRGNNVS